MPLMDVPRFALLRASALVAALVALLAALAAATPAAAAWSAPAAITGFSGGAVVAGIDRDGTQQLGFAATAAPALAGGPGLYNLRRAGGGGEWAAIRVAPYAAEPRFAFARNGAGVVAWLGASEGGKPTVWAAYREAGQSWSAPTKLDNPNTVSRGPVAAISDTGQAAVVWMRKSDAALLGPDELVYAATATGAWGSAPATLAAVGLPDPQIADGTGGFLYTNCGPSGLSAGVLPSGLPIAAWDDPYGSFKQHTNGAVPADREWGLCGVRVATPGGVVAVTPRPAVGWNQTPDGPRSRWNLRGLEVDPVTGETALVIRGSDDALTASDATCDVVGPGDIDYCFNGAATETRVALGTGAGIAHPGSAISATALPALRNGFVALASAGPSPLAAGVGETLPSLLSLSSNEPLTAADIAVGDRGEAQLVLHDGSELRAFSAPAGAGFGDGVEIQAGPQGSLSVAVGCNGDALLGWDAGGSIFTAVEPSGAPPCTDAPPDPEEPTDPGGPADPPAPGGGAGGGGSAAGGSSGATAPVASTPPLAAPALRPLKCRKGFQKKKVAGKPRCVKKKALKRSR
jgi:hypothetical protein